MTRMLPLLLALGCTNTFDHSVTVDIDAPPEVVWQVLTEFDAYEDWNPWIIEAEGGAEVGDEVVVTSRLNNETRVVDHEVIEVAEPVWFCWKDLGWFTAFAEGERCRSLTPTFDGGTTLQVDLVVTGSMIDLVELQYGDAMRAGMDAEAEALADRAESLYTAN